VRRSEAEISDAHGRLIQGRRWWRGDHGHLAEQDHLLQLKCKYLPELTVPVSRCYVDQQIGPTLSS